MHQWKQCLNDLGCFTAALDGYASLISMPKRSRTLHDRDGWSCINDFHAQTARYHLMVFYEALWQWKTYAMGQGRTEAALSAWEALKKNKNGIRGLSLEEHALREPSGRRRVPQNTQ